MTVKGDLRHTILSAIVLVTIVLSTLAASPAARAAEVSADGAAEVALDFGAGLEGWDATGGIDTPTSGGHDDGAYAALPAGASMTTTLTGLTQGSYTLDVRLRGAASDNNAKVVVSETGGPESVVLLDTHLDGADAWTRTAHRNVLVYNGQAAITVTAGSAPIDVDDVVLTLDAADDSVANWGFEDGLTGWTPTGAATLASDEADTGGAAVRLEDGAEVAQVVSVEPSTRYAVTMRAKVDREDTHETIGHESWRGRDGEWVERTSLGNRVNVGVRTTTGEVLRQAPAGTADYGLVSVTFETGPEDTEVVVYANTVYDTAYVDSVTVHTADGTEAADGWTGNGADSAYVDNVDLFVLDDDQEIKGADVSFLQAEEDMGGKYFANGVQQDGLRILANRGVNSIISMIFVDAGEQLVSYDTLLPVFQSWTGPDGQPYPKQMIQGGYWDETHTQELAQRATELGMSFLPSFHYSDAWVSAAKAYTPSVWTNVDYEGNRTHSDLAHLESVVYTYVHDFLTDLVALDVDLAGVKAGNEQNGGLLWPAGLGATSEGHAAVITATYEAAADVAPGLATSIHTNNGYDVGAGASFFNGLEASGALFDGEQYSLYGGRSSGNIIEMGESMNADANRRYREYIDVEAGFSFTRYKPTHDQQTTQLGQSQYYRNSPNGQYNWLLDYMQAPLDYPNPYGQKRGFYYWEAVWIPTPGVGSSDGGTADVNNRILFNNGDVSIREMGSAQPGKSGDAMDSLYAYLIRGVPKQKDADVQTPLGTDNGYADGVYSVDPVEPTGISLVDTAVTVEVGSKQRIKPVVTPADQVLTDSVVTYATDDEGVAAVTHEGFVVGVAAGTATVTATDAAGHSATATVTVPEPVAATAVDVTVDGEAVADGATVSTEVKESLDLAASVGDATRGAVVYTSSDPDVASFFGETHQTVPGQAMQRTDAGTLVQLDIHAAGSTTITVESLDGAASTSFTVDATKVAVTGVELDVAEATLDTGRSLQLAATVLPADASFYKVVWESADDSLATVDETGLVTAVAEGDVVIRAISADDDTAVGEALIHVVPVRATGVILDRETMTLQLGTTKQVNALVLPEDTANTAVTWSTSDDAVVSVDAEGAVTGIALGTATVTATTDDGGFTASAVVTVQEDAVPVTGLTLDTDAYWFESDAFSTYAPQGAVPTVTLQATVVPADATDDAVTWTSDDVTVARVNAFGIVTPVSPGVARITATTAGGEHSVTVPVHVPSASDSFDNIDVGDAWGTGAIPGYGGYMTGSVQDLDGNHVLVATGSGSGGRGIQKAFPEPMVNDLVVVDFDWNVGAPEGSKGAYVTLADSSQQRYLSIQTNWKTELVYSSGGRSSAATSNEPLSDTSPVGTGFDANDAWYNVHAEIDFRTRATTFTVTSLDDPALTATHTVPFADMEYTGDVASLQLWTTRSGSMRWETMLDDVNVYAAAPAPRGIETTADAVRLVPIAGTLGASAQLGAAVLPAEASQAVVWTSADTSVATVTADGLVTAANLVSSLDQVVPGATTVRVASVADPEVFVDIPVTVTDTIRASEFFWIEDEDSVIVFEEGGSNAPLEIDAGDPTQLIARLTGGDGDSDIAAIIWSSSDPSIAAVDPATGELVGWTEGTATITVEVTMYAGDPKTAQVQVNVTGNAVVAESIEVTAPPATTEVVAGSELDLSSLEVTASMTDGSSRVLTAADYDIVGFDAWTLGEQEVTVALALDPTLTATFAVTVVDQELPTGNLLANGSFESGWDGWDWTWNKAKGSVTIKNKASDSASGSYHLSVWNGGSVDFVASQEIRIMPGWYTLTGAAHGNSTNTEDTAVFITGSDGELVGEADIETAGQYAWQHPVVGPIYLDGGTITAGVRVKQAAGDWTAIDDIVLTRVPAPDPGATLDAIDAAGEVVREAYSASSLSALDAALQDATEATADLRATQDELDAAAAAVDSAIAALEEIGYIPLDDYRIAVVAGELPELPATLELVTISDARLAEDVVWEDVDPADFEEPYAVVGVHGTAGATEVVLLVEVVPAGLTYFVDAGAAVTTTDDGPVLESPSYDVVAPLAALRNDVADGAFDPAADEPWGLVSADEDDVAARADVAGAKHVTAWELPDGTVEYRFWLPVGSYELTAGFGLGAHEDATLRAVVTHEGVATASEVVALDDGAPEGAATVAFTTYRDSVVSLAVDGVDGSAAILSWVGLVDTSEPETPGAATAAPGAGTLSSDNGWDTGLADGDYTVSWDMWWGQNATSVAFYEDGTLIGATRLDDVTPASQHAEVAVSGRANGTYTYVVVARNAQGATTSQELVVEVTDAAPGRGVLSHDNWDKDGDFTITFDLWWGTNGTTYRLYEDGVLIDEQELVAGTPDAQRATTVLTGRDPGRHTYVAELVNAAGATSTKPITVTVR